jgi:exosortase
MSRRPISLTAILVTVATVTLLVPYWWLLLDYWSEMSRPAAGSILAVVAAAVIGCMELRGLRPMSPTHTNRGIALVTLAVACYVLAVLADFRLGVGILGPAILATLLYMVWGRHGMASAGLGLVLLVLASPLPSRQLAAVTSLLLDATATAAHVLLEVVYGSISRTGYVLHLPVATVTVVEGCSGIGSLFMFLPISLIAVYVLRPISIIRGASLAVIAIVLGFGINLGRVITTALLVSWRPHLATSAAMHEALGVITVILGLAMLWLTACCLAPSHRKLLRRNSAHCLIPAQPEESP